MFPGQGGWQAPIRATTSGLSESLSLAVESGAPIGPSRRPSNGRRSEQESLGAQMDGGLEDRGKIERNHGMKPADVVEVDLEKVGVLRSPVAAE